MNILELDNYRLSDAVKFNDTLNPRLWDEKEHLRPDVREALLKIAADFSEFLGISDLELKDITVTGSNAAYTYTPNSDIDLHLVVDLPEADRNEVYRELFDAKKYQYNDMHSIKIGGYDVELYVENANQKPHSQGIYSVLRNEWIDVPRRRRAEVDDVSTRNKYEDLARRIDQAVESGSQEQLTALAKKIRELRQAGLDQHGEFGPENLAFKMLRTQGKIKELYAARNQARDQELSLRERAPRRPFIYGFKNEDLDTDGVMMTRPSNMSSESIETEDLDTDGVMMTTPSNMSSESKTADADADTLNDFVQFCADQLKLKELPTIKLRRDPQWPVVNKTFGRYIDDRNLLEVAFGQRHIMDVLRTVAHELTHRRQHEREAVPGDAGETGSKYENEANARAGILMRDYGQLHPDLFDDGDMELGESQENPWQHIGFDLRSDILWPAKMFESHDPEQTADFTSWLTNYKKSLTKPEKNKKCILAMLNRTAGKIMVFYGPAEYLGQTATHYVLNPGTGEHLYTKDNQLVFATSKDFKDFVLMLELKYAESNIDVQKMPVMESASGYIPTKKQAKDPRWSMALTQDIRPGQLGKEANKLKLRTNSQGQPQLANPNGLFEQLMLEYQASKLDKPKELAEVRMAPSNLAQFARSPEAEGIRAGFEAELIFRDTTNEDSDSGDLEPDYDADERARSIQGVIEFFQGGDYGYLSDRQRDKLEDNLNEMYYEWHDNQMYQEWQDEREDLIRHAWLEEQPMSERIHAMLVDGMDLSDEEADRIQEVGDLASKGLKGSEMSEEQLDMFMKYKEAKEGAEEILDEEVQTSIDKEDKIYSTTLDDFRDNYMVNDDSGFFDDVGLRWMSDVANEFDLDWPYMQGGSNGGSRDWESIGDSLNATIGMPVKVSTGYHQTARKEGLWIVEPDSSLDPDDSEDVGLEIVSPPMPLLQAIEKLQQVVDWANDPAEGNAYTNESTGLHMGVSIPYKEGRVDCLKLILFLGDEHVLQKFGRESNTYTKAAIKDIRRSAGTERNAQAVMDLLKNNLIELAERELVGSTGTGKYTSAHKQDKYIEFRSAGGDWLAKADEDIGALENTMMRYAYAMYLAGNPSLERREYAKKLYKLVAPEGDSTLALFSQYAAGELDKEQLKKRWAEKTLNKENPQGAKKSRWKLYSNNTRQPVQGQEYNGFTYDEARARAKQKISPASSDRDFDQAYTLRDVGEGSNQWRVYRADTGETLEIVNAEHRGEAVDDAYEKYSNVIPFKVEPYNPEQPAKELTPRAKLAQRIIKPGSQQDKERLAIDAMNQAGDRIGAIRAGQSTNPNPTIQEPEQVRMSNGVPVWEIVDRETGSRIQQIADHTQREAHSRMLAYLQSIGAEDPATYGERFIVRPKMNTVSENFADGKGPGRPGDSQRHGIPKGATIAQLEKAAKAPGRKGQLARWQLNMRRGKKK